MKKFQPTSTEQAPDLNYKQLAKVKYLTKQCRELATLRSLLQDVSVRSKNLLQLAGTVPHGRRAETKMENQFDELRELLMKTRNELECKRDHLERHILQADRNKKEDQLLYRRILQSYEQKISDLKETVLNREAYIQRLQKDRRQNKKVVLDKKLLLCNQSNVQHFFRLRDEMEQVKRVARQNIKLKVQLNKDVQEIHKLENVLTKLKMARQTRMPFYKFRDIMKNGIERMSDNDRQEYEFLVGQAHVNRQLENGVKLELNSISSENLYLILKKEELNGLYLREMIAEQVKRQETYQQQNTKFKEAIRHIEEQQMCKDIGHRIEQELDEVRNSKWESMSQKPGSRRKFLESQNSQGVPCSPEEYRIFLNNMAQNLKSVISELFFLRITKVAKRAKSQQPISRLWPEREQRSPVQPIFKESFYEKCDNFITERFYEDIQDVSY